MSSAPVDSIAQICSDTCAYSVLTWSNTGITAGIGSIGAAIGWLLKALKVRRETQKIVVERDKLISEREKLTQETIKLRSEFVRNKNDSENMHVLACADLEKELANLITNVIARNPLGIDASRELCCSIISNRVLIVFRQLVELKAIIYPDAPRMFREYAIKELARYCDWLDTINNKTLLGIINKSPLKISSQYFYEFNQIIDEFSDEDQRSALNSLQAIRSRLGL